MQLEGLISYSRPERRWRGQPSSPLGSRTQFLLALPGAATFLRRPRCSGSPHCTGPLGMPRDSQFAFFCPACSPADASIAQCLDQANSRTMKSHAVVSLVYWCWLGQHGELGWRIVLRCVGCRLVSWVPRCAGLGIYKCAVVMLMVTFLW